MRLFAVRILLLFIFMISSIAFAQDAQENVSAAANVSPQETLLDFSMLMFSGINKDSNTKDLARALDLLEPDNINGKNELKSSLLNKAKNLLFLLQSINYSPEDIVVLSNDGKKASLELKDENNSLVLDFVKTENKGWVIAKSNFDKEAFSEAVGIIENIKESLAKYADTFIPALSSPLNSFYTFLYGVQGVHGYNLEDAVKVLNLSKLDPKVAQSLGPTWAVQAYRMLRFASTVKPESLPNDPMYDGQVVLLLDKDYGMINMELFTDEVSGKKAWKIEYSGTSSFNKVYDSYMNQGMLELIKNVKIPVLPLHIRLDDFFQIYLPFLEIKFLGINLWKYLLMILLALSTYIIRPVVSFISFPLINFVMSKFNVISNYDTKQRFILPLQIIVIAYIWLQGIVIITANPRLMVVTIIALNIILCITVTLIIYRFIDSSCSVASDRFSTSFHILTNVFSKLLKIVVLIAAGLYICYVLNIDTTNFLAALGIGGFAFALAGKDTIENFFGSIMIIADRPFKNGDYIIIDGIEGCIEQVGVRSTTIRTLNDSVITVPNRKFISSSVENFEMRKWRRYKTSFGILYQTDVEKIIMFTRGLDELIRLHPDSNNDKTQVFFDNFGDSALEIYVSIFFRNRGRLEELKARESINLQTMRLAKELGIEFAYPTQTLFINKQSEDDSAANEICDINSALEVARRISPYYHETDK